MYVSPTKQVWYGKAGKGVDNLNFILENHIYLDSVPLFYNAQQCIFQQIVDRLHGCFVLATDFSTCKYVNLLQHKDNN